jgi:transcriptional regulator GlxA family with amidase domain
MNADIATAIVMSPHCVLSGVMGVLDVLTTANYVAQQLPEVSARFRPVLVSDGGGAVQGSNGLCLAAKNDLPDPATVALAIVPSGPPAIYGAVRMRQALAGQTRLIEWLRAVHAAGGTLASCCTGSFQLAATGLLDGRLATTHWRAEAAFRALFPQVELRIDSLLLEEERVITGGGAQSFSTTVLRLIRQHLGDEVASGTARLMLAEGRTSGQNAFRQWLPPLDHGDAAIARAQEWLETNYREAFDLESFAARLHLTPRTLMRRFKQATGLAPLQYQQRLRVEAAKAQLEATHEPANRIVWQTGYEDVSSFQRLFKRETGLTMAEYRQRFGGRRYGVAAAAPSR